MSFSLKKGRFDLRKGSKSDRASNKLLNELFFDSKKKKGPTKKEIAQLAKDEKEAEKRRLLKEKEKEKEAEKLRLQEEKEAEQRRLQKIKEDKEAERIRLQKIKEEKEHYKKLVDDGLRTNRFEQRQSWDDETHLKLVNDEDALPIVTILIAFKHFSSNFNSTVKLDSADIEKKKKKGQDIISSLVSSIGLEKADLLFKKINTFYPHTIDISPRLIPHKINLQENSNYILLCRDVSAHLTKKECENIMKFKCDVASIDREYLFFMYSDGVSKNEHYDLKATSMTLGLGTDFYKKYLDETKNIHIEDFKERSKSYMFKDKTLFLPNILWLSTYVVIVFLGFFGPIPWWAGIISLFAALMVITKPYKDD